MSCGHAWIGAAFESGREKVSVFFAFGTPACSELLEDAIV
jgi:hypothetical protein